MYLIDTDVISEARKRANANRGVIAFFESVDAESEPVPEAFGYETPVLALQSEFAG
jgi:hypothetical protein